MTAGISATIANAWLDGLGNAADWTAPTAFWVKLHKGDPGSAGTANAATNTTRKQASFGAASAGSIATDADLSWTNVSTTETYTHWSAWTLSSGGTFIHSRAFDSPIAVTAGDDFTVTAGDIVMSVTPVAA